MLVIEYRIHEYTRSDALRPDPKFGKRIYHVDEANSAFAGWSDEDFITASNETAPERYSLATIKRVGAENYLYDARLRFPMESKAAAEAKYWAEA